MSWPGRIEDAGGIRHQFHHMIDIVPTILEATGIQPPVMVDGIAQKPIEGVSMAYTFGKGNAKAPSTRKTQYFEMWATAPSITTAGSPPRRRPSRPWAEFGRWRRSPDVVNGYNWELYNLAEDYSQATTSRPRCPTSCAT